MKNKNRCSKKIFSIIGIAFLSIFVIAVGIVAVIANKNVKAMNNCVEAALAELQKHYTVTERDPQEYKEITLYGVMKFHVEQYDIKELGNLSVMRVNMGVMQMATFVITPRDTNMPLLSADYIYVLSNRKAYMEFYDVVEEKDSSYLKLLDALGETIKNYDYLEKVETAPAWYEHLLTVTAYKGGSFDTDQDLQNILVDSLTTYLKHAKQQPLLTEEEKARKQEITVEYTDGLIEKGGISTDVFKKELGDEETRKFFSQVFFGTGVEEG